MCQRLFYKYLFNPDPVDQQSVQILLDAIEDGPKLSTDGRYS